MVNDVTEMRLFEDCGFSGSELKKRLIMVQMTMWKI